MNWLRWLTPANQRAEVQNEEALSNSWQQGRRAEELLAEPIFAEKLRELKSLISVTPHYYELLYLQPLYAFSQLVQQLPHPNKKDQWLLIALERVIAALKLRRGYMLPLGADTESCYSEQDAWTYAIFTAALFQDCWLVLGAFQITIKDKKRSDTYLWQPLIQPSILHDQYYRFTAITLDEHWKSANPVLVKVILTEKSFKWLCEYPRLFPYWWDSICECVKPHNPIIEILQRIDKQVSTIELSTEPVVDNEETLSQEENKNLSENEDDIEPNTTISRIVSVPVNKQIETWAEKFIKYLKREFARHKLFVNQPDSILHRVQEGVFLMMPETAIWLEAHYSEIKDLASSNYNGNMEDFVLAQFKEGNQCIKNKAQNTIFHHYYVGRWDNRNIVKGLLIPLETFFRADNMPPVNEQLHQESIL